MLYGVPAHWVRVQSRRVQINNIATTQQQQPLPQHQRTIPYDDRSQRPRRHSHNSSKRTTPHTRTPS